ncbi:sugar-binding protein [Coraliomargarita algicola]|uniref:Sugar-binding protein n=1 Tax=Coraliomargarita algicola TaxID=3092156 RepID=A0ABZ0RKD1_9BACT|nr:sugar-binding protein [Coraliomargarita sp. J2-16]WPJ95616.1 sugar-binding protein [Coraliomargarita sp. J2-16]
MMHRFIPLLCLLSVLVHCSTGEPVLNGPDFLPPFENQEGQRVDAELRVVSFLDPEQANHPVEAASVVFGNKRLAVREQQQRKMETGRDNVVTVFVNDQPLTKLILVATYRTADGHTVSMTDSKRRDMVSLITDVEDSSVRWKSRYPLPDGTKTEFTYQLKSLGASRVELSWDIGCSAEQIAQFRQQGYDIGNYLVYFDIEGDYRKDDVTIDGVSIEPHPIEVLKANEMKEMPLWTGQFHSIAYAPTKPMLGFEIQSEHGLNGVLRETYRHGRVHLGFKLNASRPQDSLILDLGKVALAEAATPPAVEGNDLWAQDALHIPLLPTRNLFPNPSFEQGMRYWRWWSGGALYSPSEQLRWETDSAHSRFGEASMVMRPVQQGSLPLRSFSLPTAKGKTYTLSWYAKAEKEHATLKVAPFSSKDGGQFNRNTVNGWEAFDLSTDWQRFQYSFLSDGSPISFILLPSNRSGNIWMDGMQFEVGDRATEFVSAPLEGAFVTSHPQNNLEYGSPVNARYLLRGEVGTTGKLSLSLENFYNATLWQEQLHVQAGQQLDLPFDSLQLATGVYVLRAHFEVPGVDAYDDYYRFTVIDSLDGTHATKDLYGALVSARTNRSEEYFDLMQRVGFVGSSSYGPGKARAPMIYELREKYHITDYTHEVVECPHLNSEQKRNNHPDFMLAKAISHRLWRKPEERKAHPPVERFSDELLAQFEDLCERVARECPYVCVWSIATEEEITMPIISKYEDFDEYAKLQRAFYRGIKRGNPDAIALPSGGTSGYGKIRGKDDINGFLKATQGEIKWDAVAIHPYGSIDGTLGAGDLDESIQMLKDNMAQFGYGDETPILLNEGGGGSSNIWGDGPSYSYSGGQPSYDIGLHEFLHASKMARQYIMCLKYWPQVPHYNSWQSEVAMLVDYNLTPSSFLLGMNTLGQYLGEPNFVADIRPAPGVRGYAFDDAEHGAVAAVWCTIDEVERGYTRGPVMRMQFSDELPTLIDLMGRETALVVDDAGWANVQLTPAPLFLKGGQPQALARVLQNAEVIGAGSNVSVVYRPTMNGKIEAITHNLTGRVQTGSLQVGARALPFELKANAQQTIELPGSADTALGELHTFDLNYVLQQPGLDPVRAHWNMDYFYVPKLADDLDWSRIPEIEMTNLYRPTIKMKQTVGGHPGDIAARFKIAWDADKLYLRVEAEDDLLITNEPKFWSSITAQRESLYMLDGCLEVYFDCGANGRINNQGFDLDDYRYDFSVDNPDGQTGKSLVCRFREVFKEYAGGVEFPTKAEAAAGIQAEFTRISDTRYAYTIAFEQKYIAPLRLEAGSQAGFALYLHDRMDDGTFGDKGLSLATEAGSHVDAQPQLWPIMVLSDQEL